MKEPDYERAKAKVMELGTTIERSWRILDDIEGVRYGTMPALPDQALMTIVGARRVRPLAESYRGFSVGACAMIERDGQAIALGYGVNMKDAPGDSAVNLHAEEYILNSLRDGDKVRSLSLVAPLQSDQASQIESLTLHPCTYRCQPMMAESPHVDAETVIFCGSADGTKLEWGTLADFQRFHVGEPDSLVSVQFRECPAVLIPPPAQEVYSLDDPALDIDTSNWDRGVVDALIDWSRARGIQQLDF